MVLNEVEKSECRKLVREFQAMNEAYKNIFIHTLELKETAEKLKSGKIVCPENLDFLNTMEAIIKGSSQSQGKTFLAFKAAERVGQEYIKKLNGFEID